MREITSRKMLEKGEHFTEKCKKCEKVITTCRCMSPNKTIVWVDACDECKQKQGSRDR